MATHQPRKRFGQHWLKDQAILHEIVAAAELEGGDRVLEIGPGTGILTRQLLPLVESVVAVEIDRDLCQKLTRQFSATQNFHLIQGSILDLDLKSLSVNSTDSRGERPCTPTEIPGRDDNSLTCSYPNKVVANIPYYITGPILEKLLGTLTAPVSPAFETIVLLVQKEVADRLYAQPGSKTFGALSVRIQYLAHCELICPVPARAFQPPPKVDSAVVRLRPRPFQPAIQNVEQFDTLVKLGFATKRKMLRNNLKALIDREQLTPLLENLNIQPTARAEDLSVEDWVNLSNLMGEREE